MLKNFIESNYKKASNIQRSFDHDAKMVKMHKGKVLDGEYIQDWMRGYGLFQGISGTFRKQVIEVYKENIFTISSLADSPNDGEVEKMVSALLNAFYEKVPRRWLSAVSKLLWCSFPYEIAIYDAFVHRSLVVLQGLTPYLAEMPRLGNAPSLKSGTDILALVDFYMNFRKMIVAILKHHQTQFDELRKKYSEEYPYDIRILDKLLWLLGGPGQPFLLGYTQCI
ncbi:MAG: hypothetical protein AUJ47_10560 [Candidatus Marinimicrobia bacterium CG1_02_48_14]|nr:MAG: hypothetical protein AUJ47_10560 [Candidatus Marinimicrobia bacterium CG1_02_48_14]